MVQPAFFHRQRDIRIDARVIHLEEREAPSFAALVLNVHRFFQCLGVEIPRILIRLAHAILVFIQFGAVIRLGENVLKQDGVRNADAVRVLHGANHPAVVVRGVVLNFDMPHLHLRAFIHHEGNLQRRWRNLFDLRIDGGILTAALRQVLLEHHGRALDLVRIVLRFHAQADLAFLEAVQNFGDGDGFGAGVFNGTDHAPLDHYEANQKAGASRFGFQADIVETSGIPQGHEIPAQRFFVINIAGLGNNQSL